MKKIIISALIILTIGFTFSSAYSAQKLSGNVKKAIKYMETGQNGLAVQTVKSFDFYEKKDFINFDKKDRKIQQISWKMRLLCEKLG